MDSAMVASRLGPCSVRVRIRPLRLEERASGPRKSNRSLDWRIAGCLRARCHPIEVHHVAGRGHTTRRGVGQSAPAHRRDAAAIWKARSRGQRHRALCAGAPGLSQDYHFGHPGTDSIAEPRLRCNVFALLSRSILLSSPVRLQIGSGQGVPATPAATLPTPLRPCLSATPRSGCPALAALPSGHRQRPDPAQHVTEQPPVQMSLGQQQPVVAGMFDQTAAGLH